MHTSGFVMQDQPNPDGHIFVPVYTTQVGAAYAANTSYLVNGPGLSGQFVANSGAWNIPISNLIFRYGMQDDSQMLFGGLVNPGANTLALTPGVPDNTPYSRTPRSPVPSASIFGTQQGKANTIAKGIGLRGITAVIANTGGALTSASLAVTKTQFSLTTSAPVVTYIIPNAQNGIPLSASANPVLTYIPVPTANQVLQNSRFSEYSIYLNLATATSAFVYGFFLDVSFNYN